MVICHMHRKHDMQVAFNKVPVVLNQLKVRNPLTQTHHSARHTLWVTRLTIEGWRLNQRAYIKHQNSEVGHRDPLDNVSG